MNRDPLESGVSVLYFHETPVTGSLEFHLRCPPLPQWGVGRDPGDTSEEVSIKF